MILVKKYVLRQQQQSILIEEKHEMLTIHEVEVSGVSGYVVGHTDVYKRDSDTDWFASSKELANELADEDISELMWSGKPELEEPNAETVKMEIQTNHRVRG